MELSFKNRFSAGITVVANEFIDQYMADANGEYVKVYLYLLRHEGGEITVEAVADGLHIYENPVGVLTNNPPFAQQMFMLLSLIHI